MSRSINTVLLLGGAASAVFMASGSPVEAQTAPESPVQTAAPPVQESVADPAAQVDDIVVTARRRSETLVSVPVVVNVLTAETLERNRADSLAAIGELTPTVVVGAYKSNGGGSIGIRGVSSPANQTGFEQAVSVAIDGVQTSDGRVTQSGFFDLQQVEVMKGPQALFFGKNSPAGVISIKSADPTSDFMAQARVGYEFVGDEVNLEGVVSGPLNDIFGARLAVKYRNLDGWLRNTAQPTANPFYVAGTGAPVGASMLPGTSDPRPGDEELLGRLTLTADFSENFTARLKVFASSAEGSGPGVGTQNVGPCTGGTPRVYGIADPFGECEVDRNTTVGDLPEAIASTMRGYRGDTTPYDTLDILTAALDLNWTFGSLNLASTTGYNRTDYEFLSGLDQSTYSQLAFWNHQVNEEISQELRLTSDFSGPLNFMFGAYAQQTSISSANDTKLRDSNYVAAVDRYVSYEDINTQDGDTLSFFGQGLWDITDTLELAGGLRWTRETKDARKQNLYGVGAFNNLSTVYAGSDEIGVMKGHFEDENLSPEATLTWRPDSNHTVFLAYKTGYKSGGFGLTSPFQTTTLLSDIDFGPESAEGFEVGGKGVFYDGRMRLNVAAFAYDFTDLQVNTYDPARIAYTVNNAGTLEQRGVEADGTFRVTDGLMLRAAVAFVDAQFKDFIGQCYSYAFPTGTTRASATPPPNCSFVDTTSLTLQQDFDGRAPARSPEWAGSAGFTWDVPVGSYNVSLNGDGFYTDEYYASEAMSPGSLQDAFWRFNAGVTLTPADSSWSLQLLGRNLTDEYYLQYAADRTGGNSVPGAFGEQRGVVSRGREVALQFTYNY